MYFIYINNMSVKKKTTAVRILLHVWTGQVGVEPNNSGVRDLRVAATLLPSASERGRTFSPALEEPYANPLHYGGMAFPEANLHFILRRNATYTLVDGNITGGT